METALLRTLLYLFCFAPATRAEEPANDTIAPRAQAALDTAMADPKKFTGMSPMHFWVAQRLMENPWMRQEWEANLVITNGETKRVYDVKEWTVTDLSVK